MLARLVNCSAANLALTWVVMAESFTYASACDPVRAASSSANAAALASSVPRSTQAIEEWIFMVFPQALGEFDYRDRWYWHLFAAVPLQRGYRLRKSPRGSRRAGF